MFAKFAQRPARRGLSVVFLAVFLAAARSGWGESPGLEGGLQYTNYRVPKIPWSIHVVQVDRTNRAFSIHSVHAGGGALGLSTLSQQVAQIKPTLGEPVAALNGDYYQRDKAYAGDARGLQVVETEVTSAPTGGASFWVDLVGDLHLGEVSSRFTITWPDGRVTPVGLNENRPADGATLYTAAIGGSTRTAGGGELVLERNEGAAWLPLRLCRTYVGRVREVRAAGDTPVTADTLVVSLAPKLLPQFSNISTGALLRISTETMPKLVGVRTALSGGPVLVQDGRAVKVGRHTSNSYQVSSMTERHPRSALGWNGQTLFLVEVDGRQRDLSDGMTLDELAAYLVQLGCQQAMNFDGGGSSTLWFEGKVRNSPCDGHERGIANSLVILRGGKTESYHEKESR